ncbi:MAG TPA: hypothetical protein VFM88_19210 [Vicinamibacteria bacterium]|nr:hypothetical protein [Vicinamibacteria bacterium]
MRSTLPLSCAVLLVAAIGCSREKPAATPQPVASPPATAAPSPDARAAVPAGPAPIATADGKSAGVRVEVTELKRASGGTVNLKFAVINDSDRDLQVADVTELLDMNATYAVGGVHLIDPVGKKKYFVARDSAGQCVCSQYGAVAKGRRANHWAKFPAPPDDVERISVVIPTFSPMDDVPLSR